MWRSPAPPAQGQELIQALDVLEARLDGDESRLSAGGRPVDSHSVPEGLADEIKEPPKVPSGGWTPGRIENAAVPTGNANAGCGCLVMLAPVVVLVFIIGALMNSCSGSNPSTPNAPGGGTNGKDCPAGTVPKVLTIDANNKTYTYTCVPG